MKRKIEPILFVVFCLFCIVLGELLSLAFLLKLHVNTHEFVPTPQSVIQSLPLERKNK